WNFNAASTQFDFIELTGTASITVGTNAFNINLGGSGDFNVLDAGTAIFTVNETNLITLNNEITDHTLINGLASVTSDFEVSGTASVSSLTVGGKSPYLVGGTDVSLADGGTGASLVDPNADRFFMWDDSANSTVLAGLGGFLTFTDTPTLTVASNSLGFGQLQDTLTLDANLTVSSGSGPFSTTWHGDFFLKDNSSVSGNFEVSGNASASQLYGADLSTCTSSQKLQWASGVFTCETDQTGSGGANLGVREGFSGNFTNRSSLSFDPAHFVVRFNSAQSEASISLDWGLGGPASLSENETISGNWVNTTNPWADNEVADTLTLTNITGPTSLSGNFELQTGYASASQYFGATLADCDSNGSQLLWSSTGLFSCQTLNDDDIPDTITLTRYLDSDIPIVTIGNTASSAFERSLAVKSPLTLTDGGANSTITFGLSSDSLDFDEFVDSMTLDANLT
ncbi:MAG: hypothetical protein Q7R31_02515, partial [Candidatus Levybacteria bacterium]|nr:hypothetical protein [Candidatus Levybacteria bacterium]